MKSFKDMLIKNAYYQIKDNKISERAMFTAIEIYLKKPITDRHKNLVREYAQKIKAGELTFDEYWTLYQSKLKAYEANN